AGNTYSLGTGNGKLPFTQGAAQTHNGGGSDAFVARFNTLGSGSGSLVYSTFLGGSSDETAYGIAIDSTLNAYVTGQIYAFNDYPNPPVSDFPTVNPFQSSFNRGNLDPLAGNYDGFVTKVNAAGTGLIFSTFLGGGADDRSYAIALDPAGKVYVAGKNRSTDFPTYSYTYQTFYTSY